MAQSQNVPNHIAIVMDGNGRWAENKSLPRLAGHDGGMKALTGIVRACGEIGVGALTVYAFSTENWKRPEDEVKGIFNLLIVYIEKELKALHKENVKVSILGDYSKLPSLAVKKLEKCLETTKNNTGLHFNIALNYGSRAEILMATKAIGEKLLSGEYTLEDITEEAISNNLYTSGVPDPDLIIRTSGEHRLSNFLLWQTAYSEFYFTDVLWPDFDRQELDKAIEVFNKRDRRFGGINKK